MEEDETETFTLPQIDWTQDTVTISDDDLEEMFDGGREPASSELGIKVLSDRITYHARWSVHHEVVFTMPGAPVGVALLGTYESPATESQCGGGWSTRFKVVRAVAVVRIEYMPREKAARVEKAQSNAWMQSAEIADWARAAQAAEAAEG